MGKFGNIPGGTGKRVVGSMDLPASARGKIAHAKQSDATPSVDEDFNMHSGRTNQTPGRKVNDVLGAGQRKTITNNEKSKARLRGGNAGDKGFVDKRAREFTNYR